VEEVAAREPHDAERLEAVQRLGAEDVAEVQRLLAAGTVTDVLAYLNSDEAIATGLRPYVGLVAPIAHGGRYPGADVVANWYARNLRIFANLMRVTEPGDRVLVFFGAGHVPVLRHLLEASGEADVVRPESFLGGKTDGRHGE
jgi:hypothetical protein